jgi:uncharacterized protein (TIGR02594 family)
VANYMELLGGLAGKNERRDHSAIQEYLRNGGQNLDPATTAWCAAIVNSSLKQAGLPTTGSNLARSFLNYGTPVTQPQRGDIAVFPRGDPNGPYGHVGFVDSVNNGKVRLLAGNQGDAVSYADMDLSSALGFRRPDAAMSMDPRRAPTLAEALPGGQPTAPNVTAPVAQAMPDPAAMAINNVGLNFQKKQQADADAEQKRKQALFGGGGGGIASLFA